MYKSAISNLKAKNIKSFDIKNLDLSRNRKNLVLEPNTFSKVLNGFCVKQLGEMNSDVVLKDRINKNSILQYNANKNTFYIISPTIETLKFNKYRTKKCGIDIGVRTFLTTYSENECLEIGKELIPTIDKYLKKNDKLKSDLDTKKITKTKFKKAYEKKREKMENRITDMHKKVANLLFNKYDAINIGNVSIKNMVSNIKGNIREITKRRLMILKHYKFREYLKLQSIKWKVDVNEVSEYKTTMICHNCKNEKRDIGSNKIYECKKCKIKMDRDINASINIYNK
jgi:transposase